MTVEVGPTGGPAATLRQVFAFLCKVWNWNLPSFLFCFGIFRVHVFFGVAPPDPAPAPAPAPPDPDSVAAAAGTAQEERGG